MSVESLAHVWDAAGLSPEEKLILLWIANADGGLGHPMCPDWAGMAEFAGTSIDDALRVADQLAERGHIIWGDEADEESHLLWVAYGGEYFPPADFTRETKRRSRRKLALLERDGPGCTYCGAMPADYHLDHFIPRRAGGPDVIANLVLACAPCNMAKGGKLPTDWLSDRPDLLRRVKNQLEACDD